MIWLGLVLCVMVDMNPIISALCTSKSKQFAASLVAYILQQMAFKHLSQKGSKTLFAVGMFVSHCSY